MATITTIMGLDESCHIEHEVPDGLPYTHLLRFTLRLHEGHITLLFEPAAWEDLCAVMRAANVPDEVDVPGTPPEAAISALVHGDDGAV